LRAQILARGQTIERQFEHRVAAQRVGVVAVLLAAAIISMRNWMISAKRCTTFSGVRGSLRHLASRSANPSRRSISRKASKPPSEDSRPPSKRATTALPCTGDRPGRNGVASTMAGAVPVDPRVQALNPNLLRINILCYARQPS
jgi:hypothetical protein